MDIVAFGYKVVKAYLGPPSFLGKKGPKWRFEIGPFNLKNMTTPLLSTECTSCVHEKVDVKVRDRRRKPMGQKQNLFWVRNTVVALPVVQVGPWHHHFTEDLL